MRLKENIRKSVIDYKIKNQVCLGLNIFNPNMKFTYVIDLLREFNFRYLRLSITVPNFKLDDNYDALNYFYAMKPITINIIKQALAIGVTPLFDCNKPPICWFTQEERGQKFYHSWASKFQMSFCWNLLVIQLWIYYLICQR